MARHNPRPHPDPTAAEALQAAMRALHRELRAAPPEKAGDLARKLAALARDVAAIEARASEEPWESEEDIALFSAEVERVIVRRTHERVAAILKERGLEPDAPLPPEARVSLLIGR